MDLFRVIDWMMKLPQTLEQQFRRDLDLLEEEATMRYVTSIERLAKEEGLEAGILQGMQQGRRLVMHKLLERRFGQLPAWALSRLESATEADFDAWTDAVFDADSIDDVLGTEDE